MRRYIFPILFGLVLVTPFVLRAMLGAESSPAAAGNRRIVVMTPHAEGIRREYQEAFSRWLRDRGEEDIQLDYRNFGGGATEIVKYFDSSVDLYKSTGSFDVDLVWGGGDFLFDVQLRRPKAMKEGYLQPLKLSDGLMASAFPRKDIGGVPLYDPDGYWYGTALSSFGIVYNKDVVKFLGLPEPKTWTDLADPRYDGWLVLADPSRSASAKTAFMAIVEWSMSEAWKANELARKVHDGLKAHASQLPPRVWLVGKNPLAAAHLAMASAVYQTAMDPGWRRGMGLIRQIAANARVFSNNSAAVPGIVGSGDAAAGMAIDFYGRTEVEFSGESRVGYVEPTGATIVNPDPIAMVRGARNRDLAVKFVEFVLSPAGQRLLAARAGAPGGPRLTSLRRLPIVPSVFDDKADVLANFTERTNPFDVASGFNTKKERRETSDILGELIQASCKDLLGEIRSARRAVSRAGRDDLDAQIGTFPFGQFDSGAVSGALSRMRAYRAAKPLSRLEMMRAWENEFAAEYDDIKAKAR